MLLLARLLRAGFGLLLAIPAGTGVLAAAILLDPALSTRLTAAAMAGLDADLADLTAGLPPEGLPLLLAGLAWAAFMLLVVPPVLAALVGAVLHRRGAVWYGATCGAITAALPWLARGAPRPGGALAAEASLTAILFVAGASAGLVYGLVIGTGRDREAPSAG